MCGIVGVLRSDNVQVTDEQIRNMLKKIPYRGPDGDGIYTNENVGLGHVRLSIQDLSQLAAQPMVSHDGRYVLTYNGEIYNVKELRSDLHSIGVKLKSTGDTEALLEYLVEYGIKKTLAKVEGMFAFGLWDSVDRKLILARDRHGIKPLYYTTSQKGELRFASELKVLVSNMAEPDMTTINAILMGLGGTWGDSTVFRKIRHVCAGQYIVIDHKLDMNHYCFFHINDFADRNVYEELCRYSKKEVVNRVAKELEDSVEKRMISDAPVAVLASGGIDSSIIAALAAKRCPNIMLYHANVLQDSETSAAKQLAEVLGLGMRCVDVSEEDVLDNIPIATYHYESPLSYHNGSCVPFYMVSELVSKDGVKVVLTGEGSDEYFLGYPACAIKPYMMAFDNVRKNFQNFLHLFPKLGNLLWPREEYSPANLMRKLMFRFELEERRGQASMAFDFIKNKIEHDRHIMTLDMVIGNVRVLLQRNDRLAMAWGLESRFPFLGHDLARTAANLPGKYKVRKTWRVNDWRHCFISDKWVVREIARRYLPPELSQRKKFGFRSSFYDRLKVDKEFYANGFMAEYYGLNKRALVYLYETSTPRWLEQIMSLEVWGLLFCMGLSVDEVRERMSRFVRTID
jgi:asparagine synthase (glutamine-hydrolysing)